MSRQDILRAEMEFFCGGGEGGQMPSLPERTLRCPAPSGVSASYGYRAAYVGMPVASPLVDNPVLFLFVPRSRESRAPIGGRPGANMKFIEYTCDVRLAWAGQGNPQSASVGSDAYNTFCGWVDGIAELIRGGNPGVLNAKYLITPSYPNGAVAEWGEIFTVAISESALESSVLIEARFQIQAMEQVLA